MAAKKTKTDKKKINKKNTVNKTVEIKTEEKKINTVTNENNDLKENLEVINGDPAVLSAKEEQIEPHINLVEENTNEKETENIKENIEKNKKEINKNNRNIGYFWNGQIMDF